MLNIIYCTVCYAFIELSLENTGFEVIKLGGSGLSKKTLRLTGLKEGDEVKERKGRLL